MMITFKSLGIALVLLMSIFLAQNTQTRSEKPVAQEQSGTTDARTMTLTRTFDAPVAEVWKHWSDSDKVMKWSGPTGS